VVFPGLDERQWADIETVIRGALKRAALSEDAIVWILSEWKRHMRLAAPTFNFNMALPFPADTAPAVVAMVEAEAKKMGARFGEIVTALSGQILVAVVDLYEAGGAASSGAPAKKMSAQILEMIRGGKQDDADDKDDA